MKTIQLNNGVEIPIVGSGTNTFGKVDNQYRGALRGDTQEVDWAIENGYRHFDTAQAYNNEEMLGEGIKKSSLPREDFFITTKLNTFEGFPGVEWAHAEIKKSLEELDGKIRTLKARVQATTVDSNHTYHEHIAALETKRALIAEKLDSPETKTQSAWDEIKKKTDNLGEDLRGLIAGGKL